MRMQYFDHVYIAVNDLDKAIQDFSKFGLKPRSEPTDSPQGVRAAFLPLADGRSIELAEPIGEDKENTVVGRWLARRGGQEGVYLVAIAVDDLDKAADEYKEQGVELIDQELGGNRYVFVHPRSSHGVLIQLVRRESE